ncbi:WD40 repeat-like protein [Gonapodya prolifera JEL478]|uniref:WD40 repeat-like protein n=1 Tax=Gonapodya prolifera (strain JEL478) TaxID=1344416 RepID=A0A139AJ90_GONPJ|nr:WD40 repeat-like protein [Gonapodya prolifera JEL478]|eukprot:KXS16860.1 WD40 repeat-like protein [Gonapodya prolifera JEL478]
MEVLVTATGSTRGRDTGGKGVNGAVTAGGAGDKGGGGAASVQVWDPATGALLASLSSPSHLHPGPCSLALRSNTSPSAAHGPCMAYGALADAAQIGAWNWQRTQVVARHPLPSAPRAVACSHSGAYLAVGTADAQQRGGGAAADATPPQGSLLVWEIASGALVASAPGAHHRAVSSVAWSADDVVICTSGEDGAIAVWLAADLLSHPTTSKPRPLRLLTPHHLPVSHILVSPTSPFPRARLYSCSPDGLVRVHRLADGAELAAVRVAGAGSSSATSSNPIPTSTPAPPSPPTCLATDPAEHTLLVGCLDGSVRILPLHSSPSSSASSTFSSPSAAPARVLRGHKAPVTCLSVSMDGATAVSAGADGRCVVWDVGGGRATRVVTVGSAGGGAPPAAFCALIPRPPDLLDPHNPTPLPSSRILKRARRVAGVTGEPAEAEGGEGVHVVLRGYGRRMDDFEKLLGGVDSNPLTTLSTDPASSSANAVLLARVRDLEAQNARLGALAEGLWEAGVVSVTKESAGKEDVRSVRRGNGSGKRGRGRGAAARGGGKSVQAKGSKARRGAAAKEDDGDVRMGDASGSSGGEAEESSTASDSDE